ncbi:unnamed protein product [Aspergillus oryzae RIB40]|uniref:DNA, SC012 n=1 Tax=Aspergillus oryzae (strain ATCC 42149 / RIB 40) TaxID=510516 RepID=Q2UDL5_ASPOR|nr:unnamed protein product [Aspergillus oryzae RIB40]BAE60350.1 unnamed protein product [Aspergillus oryzae RIB40]
MTTKGALLATELNHQEYVQRSRLRRLRRWRRLLWPLLLIAALVILIQRESSVNIVPYPRYSTESDLFNEGMNKCYEARSRSQSHNKATSESRVNHRWNPVSGHKGDIVIQNATLFDGELTRNGTFNIHFSSGVIRSVSPTHLDHPIPEGTHIINVHGRFITPGLVDMHSHHLLLPFPQLPATDDVNERPLLGPITPFVRAIDGFKPHDPTIKIIASGGVTSSLVLPGSANIVGGEAYMVKNLPLSGAAGEPVVEELLLEYGLPENNRQRYLKMACGENPKRVYGNTRLGLTWLLRKQLEEARDLHERQSAWCRVAFDVEETSFAKTHHVKTFIRNHGKRPDSFELETLVALIRGELNVNVHCYEPEDFERMLSVLHEFGVHPQAFHHALEAWQVPELLKNLEEKCSVQGRGIWCKSKRTQNPGRPRGQGCPKIGTKPLFLILLGSRKTSLCRQLHPFLLSRCSRTTELDMFGLDTMQIWLSGMITRYKSGRHPLRSSSMVALSWATVTPWNCLSTTPAL